MAMTRVQTSFKNSFNMEPGLYFTGILTYTFWVRVVSDSDQCCGSKLKRRPIAHIIVLGT